MVETTATYNTKRQNLAAAMLELSRGWQMRDPAAVRKAEIGRALSDRYGVMAPPPENVFTLNPDAMYVKEELELWGQRVPDRGFPKQHQRLLECLVSTCANYDLLMNRERIDSQSASDWALLYRTVAATMKSHGLPRKNRRNVAMVLAVKGMASEISAAAIDVGIGPVDFREWCDKYLRDDLALMPYCGLYVNILDFRLSNLNSRWTENDFIDMLYLPCAASYADAVAAESGATEYIRRASRSRPAEPPVFAKLPELAEFLGDLASTN